MDIKVPTVNLDPVIEGKIERHEYTLDELQKVRADIAQYQAATRKQFVAIGALVVVAFAALIALLAFFMGTKGPLFYLAVVLAMFLALEIARAWQARFGTMRGQFNACVRRAYPEHADQLRL